MSEPNGPESGDELFPRDYPSHWVRKPWPEERFPTTDEWIEWFLTAPRDQQQAEVAMSIKDTQVAMRCLVMHPQPPPLDALAGEGVSA